jgi:SnoaL-like domain/Aspartyl protease
MPRWILAWFYLVLAALLSAFAVPGCSRAQEIPLEHCDSLPVIAVEVGGQPMLFLVDTGATSILNLKSFAEGQARDVQVTSWTGTLATSAREVSIRELVVGRTKFLALKLPAIDLSAVGNACGRKIDGILGVDLMARMGATIDLNRQIMHVRTVEEEERGARLSDEVHRETQRCVNAFNNSDEKTFAECLDPKITLFSGDTELVGREPVLRYFRNRYFHQQPAAKLEIHEDAFHPIGEAVWYEYEFSIDSVRGSLRGRGMAMCRKSSGRWRMASMHHTLEHFEPAAKGAIGR